MKTVRIRLLWHKQAQFAGYLIAEREKLAEAAGVRLICEPIRFDEPGLAAVIGGRAEFAVSSPSHLLESNWARELRFLLAIQQESALVYPVFEDSGIARISDLAGRRIAVWPGNEDLELKWMLHKAGVSAGAVSRVPTADTSAALFTRQVDCAQMTTYHELGHARAHGALRLFSAAAVGASLLKDGLVASRGWLAANGEVAQAAIAAILRGWTIAFTDADRAVSICVEARPDMPAAEHRAQLAAIRDLSCRHATLSEGLGYPDPRHVDRVLAAMTDLGMVSPGVTAGEVTDARFWRAAPASWRSRTWAPAS